MMTLRQVKTIGMAAFVLHSNVWAQRPASGAQSVSDFFRAFTTEWVRGDPQLATRTRYFQGEEQDELERQLTPLTLAWKQQRIALAKRGLTDLSKFDPGKMSEAERVSANVMQWQLQSAIDEGPFLDFTFPLEQFQGANVALIQALTVVHPLETEKDAANYVLAMSQAGNRLEEAMAESRRLAAKGILPPKFILEATIHQMQNFTDGSPGQNPLVTVLAQKMQAIKSMPRDPPGRTACTSRERSGPQCLPGLEERNRASPNPITALHR